MKASVRCALRTIVALFFALQSGSAQQLAPDRKFDLVNLSVKLDINASTYAFDGVVVNTIAPLVDGLSEIRLDCGSNLRIDSVKVAGRPAEFARSGDTLLIVPSSALVRGRRVDVAIHYKGGDNLDGFHWVKPTPQDSSRDGFWTIGQPSHNRGWLPTWDYPNDVATSEVTVTVPASWYVVGNGSLAANTASRDGKRRTFRWRMSQPHATYLLSIAAGSFHVKTVTWKGIPVMYVVPRGKGNLIDQSFGKTPEMLEYYSKKLGVMYPWPKYSQAALRDYAGGIENVSATSFGTGILSDLRDAPDGAQTLVAHELSHQWFGDLVTYRHWGELWLGEGFATYFGQLLYEENWHNKVRYAQHVEDMSQQYFAESRNYKRALSVPSYKTPDAMFDDHTYFKGAVVLHTLRRYLGDEVFFRSLGHYLTKYKHQAVDSYALRDALSEASGIDLGPFFAQWVFRPGHPVLDYTWVWNEGKREVELTVKQLPDSTDDPAPYNLRTRIGVITNGKLVRRDIALTEDDHLVRISASNRPDAIVLDPDHDFLREVRTLHWSASELPHILRFAPSPVDREEAMKRMLAGNPTDSAIRVVEAAIRADEDSDPVFRSIERLGELARPELRSLFRKMISSANPDRRAQAVRALGRLPSDNGDVARLRALISDKETYAVVRAAVSVLGDWDPAGNRDVLERAGKTISPFDAIRALSLEALAKADSAAGIKRVDARPDMTEGINQFFQVLAKGEVQSGLLTARQRAQLTPQGNKNVAAWLADMKSLTPLGCDDVRERRIVQNNEVITTMCFYRLARSTSRPLLIKFSLNGEGKVAYWASYPANY